MNWIEKQAAGYALRRLEGEMGANWKGKIGAMGAALGVVATAAVAFSNGQLDLAGILAAITALSGALSLYGIRQAIGPVAPPA